MAHRVQILWALYQPTAWAELEGYSKELHSEHFVKDLVCKASEKKIGYS